MWQGFIPMEAHNSELLLLLGLSVELLLPSMPAQLNSVSDSSRRHSPTKRIGGINTGRGGGEMGV